MKPVQYTVRLPVSFDREFVAQLASLGTRIMEVELLLDSTLVRACAAPAYNRQRRLSQEVGRDP